MRSALIALAALATCLVGLLVAGVLDLRDEQEPDPALDAVSDEPSSPRASKPPSAEGAGTPAPTDVPAVDEDDAPLVPRVLPPDAALEDVRDALASKDARAVQSAYERITRMTGKSASFAKALLRLVDQESDPDVVTLVRRASATPWSELAQAERQALIGDVR